MSAIDWGEFAGSSGEWQKFRFEKHGDNIAGKLADLRIATMPDGTRLPALVIQVADGSEWSLLASQIGLQRALADHRPATGDTIAITYIGDGEPKPGKNAPKLFDVKVTRGEGGSPAPAAPAAEPAGVNPADLL